MSTAKELVPMTMGRIATEDHGLMVRLNRLVMELRNQNSSLAISLELNGNIWKDLLKLDDDSEYCASYCLNTMEDSNRGHVWLNVYLTVTISKSIDEIPSMIELTPKQTFWILEQLQDDQSVMAKVGAVALQMAKKLEESAEEIRALVSSGQMFTDGDQNNKIFDNSTVGPKAEHFTNALIRRRNSENTEA